MLISFTKRLHFKKSSKRSQNHKSFTLIELLVVLVILAVLSTFSIAFFVKSTNDRNAMRVAEYIIGDIMLVRNKALAGAVFADASNTHWALRIQCNTANYSLGESNGTTFNTTTPTQNKTLETGFKFYGTGCTSSSVYRTLHFGRLTGELTDNSVVIPVRNANNTGQRIISIYKNGKVSIQ